MFKVFIRKGDNSFERKQVFHNPFEAEKYFNELCQVRMEEPAAVIATNQNLIKKAFRIDRGYPGERFQTNEDLLVRQYHPHAGATGHARHNPGAPAERRVLNGMYYKG